MKSNNQSEGEKYIPTQETCPDWYKIHQGRCINCYPSSTETVEGFLTGMAKTPDWESIHPLLWNHMDCHMFSDDQIGEINEMLETAEKRGYAEGADKGYFQGREDGRLEGFNTAIDQCREND